MKMWGVKQKGPDSSTNFRHKHCHGVFFIAMLSAPPTDVSKSVIPKLGLPWKNVSSEVFLPVAILSSLILGPSRRANTKNPRESVRKMASSLMSEDLGLLPH